MEKFSYENLMDALNELDKLADEFLPENIDEREKIAEDYNLLADFVKKYSESD